MTYTKQIQHIVLFIAAGIFFFSCDEAEKRNGGPIVLGDSSLIVTETEPEYLTDFVTDITLKTPVPVEAPAEEITPATDTAKTEAAPLEKPVQPAAQPVANVKGLTMAFKELTVIIPNIEIRSFKQQDLSRATGASYQLVKGTMAELRMSGATIQKVSQRYQTSVFIKNELGTMELDALASSTDWKEVKGSAGIYKITGLDARNLQYKKANAAQIRAAVTRSAKNSRMSRAKIIKWENSVRNLRSVNQKPLSAGLRSVMWKIEGKDAGGKYFQKQIRIDLPM